MVRRTEGTRLAGKYRLTRPAGFGGMAELWVATNEATGAEVCVKVLVPAATDEEAIKRFRREAHAAARLSHRAIVRVFDLLELDEHGELGVGDRVVALAIVMELLAGETLGDRLLVREKLTLDEALDVALPVLSALGHAHAAGVVHRDLKPDNVFLARDPDGHVSPKILDFGISKIVGDAERLTDDGIVLGTPTFMSPEQARGARTVDARSDVFSVALLLVVMLTGKNPFEDSSFHAVVSAVLTREVPRVPGVPDAVWSEIAKALAKDPKVRHADGNAFATALRRAAGREPIESVRHEVGSAPPAEAPPVARASSSRRPLLVVAAIALVLVIALALTSR